MYVFAMCIIIIIDSATLRVLDINANDIGDDGMAVLSEALEKNRSLIKLNLQWYGLSAKGSYKDLILRDLATFVKCE